MAVTFNLIKVLEGYELFGRRRSLLDIGTSNLYGAEKAEILAFFERYGTPASDDAHQFAGEVATGSARAADGSALNEAWLGQIVEAIGMDYDSIDIAAGYKTRLVDLNRQNLPRDMIGKFDVVLNCGTTEHILHQYNAFRCIHDAVKAGGVMIHQVPATGHTDHGYFTYTSRFFLDMAGYNGYELVDFWIEGPDGSDKMFAGARSYANVFPHLGFVLDRIGDWPRETRIDQMEIPNNSINVILRKTEEKPFMGMVEMSTSWGTEGAHDVSRNIVQEYAR